MITINKESEKLPLLDESTAGSIAAPIRPKAVDETVPERAHDDPVSMPQCRNDGDTQSVPDGDESSYFLRSHTGALSSRESFVLFHQGIPGNERVV